MKFRKTHRTVPCVTLCHHPEISENTQNRPLCHHPVSPCVIHDVTSRKFNADYKYEEVCSANTGKDSVDVFLEWIAEVKATQTNH